MNDEKFTFEISLSVLNHLGRNLYRSFTTVLGEAISNAWDADAKNVWIHIDKGNNSFYIKDDGIGMTRDDFQYKFLKIGYTKRKDGSTKSALNRPYIGRKGIGKLALLSCADKITVISKTKNSDYVGGVIDNSGLDQAITDDLTPDQYRLGQWQEAIFKDYSEGHTQGTIIYFENIKDGIRNSLDLLKKSIALYFRFSLIDNTFNIFLGDDPITLDDLNSLAEKTEFLWNINNLNDPYINNQLTKLKEYTTCEINLNIKGFIASVEKPRFLNVISTEEKAGIDLFVNGRLREKNILKHMPGFSTRHIASYLYGQIHFDELDEDEDDRFTTSRESVVAGDPKFENLLKILVEQILEQISKDWDKWRRKYKQDGDPDNTSTTPRLRKAEELFNTVAGDYDLPEGAANKELTDEWINSLREDAAFNLGSYADCFISENLLRKQIEKNRSTPTSCTNIDLSGNTCEDRYDSKTGNTSLCEYCKGERGKQSLQLQKTEASTSIQIRNDEDNLLMYLDYIDLAKIIGNSILRNEDKPYKPLRNSVMHTARLTQEAKTKLTSVFDNVVATVKSLIGTSTNKNL